MVSLDLPWDLVDKILSRVPATSLTRLRFTCKRWNALFKDQKFIKKHMDKATKPYLVLLSRFFRVYSLSVNINAIHNNIVVDPSIVFDAKLSRNLRESEEVKIARLFHCNGLLLCSTEEKKTNLVVVNPCTGQARWIKPRSVYHMYDSFALGYEKNNKNSYDGYKILRFPFVDRNNLEIFELKSNSWKVLANVSLKEKECILRRGISVKGNTFWLSCFLADHQHDQFHILSFDFTTERYRSFCLPFLFKINPIIEFNINIALSDVSEEKLAVLHWTLDMRPQLEIWMSKEIDDHTETLLSWSKSFIFDLHSDIDFVFLRSVSFFIDEKKKVIVCCGRMSFFIDKEKNKNMIYIVGEHCCRKLDYCTNQSYLCPGFLSGYVPSLVNLNPQI